MKKFMDLIKKVFGIGNVGKVEKAQTKVNVAMRAFNSAFRQVEKANAQLTKAIEVDEMEIAKRTQNIFNAKSAVSHNDKIMEKLSEFIPAK